MINDFITKEDLMFFTSAGRFTMAGVYFQCGQKNTVATFDLLIRELPVNRNYFVFCGLEHIIDYLLNFKFTEQQLALIKKSYNFPKPVFNYFKNLRFTGDVYAMPEGTICFPNEPVVRITAPIIEGELIEQYLANAVMLQTMLASKLSRVVNAARGKETGLAFIRAHGVEPAIKSVRVGKIVGIKKIGLPISAMRYNVPLVPGSTFHHFFQSFDSEAEAFETYARYYPGGGWMLVDTYDTIEGLKRLIRVAKKYGKNSFKGIMLDSGDLLKLSKKARNMLDKAGLQKTKIMVLSNLEEYKIDKMARQNAPVDMYTGATEIITSADAPKLEVVYKLSEIIRNGKSIPKMKLSTKKMSLPGRKQVYRIIKNGEYSHDIIGLENEKLSGKKLLTPFIKNGKLIKKYPGLEKIHDYYESESKKFDKKLFSINRKINYPVQISPGLKQLIKETKRTIKSVHHDTDL